MNGDTLWTKKYGGGAYGWSVQQTIDGGYIIVSNKNSKPWLLRTDNNGDTLWTRTYGGGEMRSVRQTLDQGYIMAGFKWGDVYLLKTNSIGDILWTKTIDSGTPSDQGQFIEWTANCSYIVAGHAGTNNGDAYLIKVRDTTLRPTAKFQADPTTVVLGDSVDFTNTSTNVTWWQWHFGDGILDTINFNTIHQYAVTGNYSVQLIVLNDCGADTTDLVIDVVCPASPIASFGFVDSLLTVSFIDSSLHTTIWLWDFGDGSTFMTQSPTHTYSIGGAYQVCLYASNVCETDTICQSVNITGTGIQEDIVGNSISCYPNPNTGLFTLEINSKKNSRLFVRLYHVTGQIIYSEEYNNVTGRWTQKMDICKYSNGIYNLQIASFDQILNKRIIKH